MDQGFKDAPTPRPNKRPRLDPTRDPSGEVAASSVRPKSGTVSDSSQKKKKHDDQLDEFMQVMQPRTKKGPSWANEFDTGTGPSSTSAGKQTKTGKAEDKNADVNDEKNDNISDLDWMKQRMSKAVDDEAEKAYEQSDDGEKDSDQKPVQVDFSLPCARSLISPRTANRRGTRGDRSEQGHHPEDFQTLPSQFGLFLHGIRSIGTVPAVRGNFSGERASLITSLIFMLPRMSSTC